MRELGIRHVKDDSEGRFKMHENGSASDFLKFNLEMPSSAVPELEVIQTGDRGRPRPRGNFNAAEPVSCWLIPGYCRTTRGSDRASI